MTKLTFLQSQLDMNANPISQKGMVDQELVFVNENMKQLMECHYLKPVVATGRKDKPNDLDYAITLVLSHIIKKFGIGTNFVLISCFEMIVHTMSKNNNKCYDSELLFFLPSTNWFSTGC